MCSGSEAGSYCRLIDSCITRLKEQGPSRTSNESKEVSPEWQVKFDGRTRALRESEDFEQFTAAAAELQLVNPKPETRNPESETRNPKPETRNPKPETRNPGAGCSGGAGGVSVSLLLLYYSPG